MQKPARSDRRSGAALVETALVLPVLLLLVFGSMEVTDAIFLKHSLKSASYEAARKASEARGNHGQANSTAVQVLHGLNVAGATISISPMVTPNTAQGTVITVTVQAPLNSNRLFLSNFMGLSGRTISATTTMTRQ